MRQESVDQAKSNECNNRLIPRGRGFRQPHNRVAAKRADISTEIETYRKRLHDSCGYSSKDMNEKERTLYIKALFILRNRKYLKSTHSRDALLMLVSDQDTLFNDGGPKYRTRAQNRKLFSVLRQEKRDMVVPLKSNPLIKNVYAGVFQPNEEEAVFSKLLLQRIVEASGKRGVYRWTFSSGHIRLTVSNCEEYANKFVCHQDTFGDLPLDDQRREEILATWLKDKYKVEKLIKVCLSEKNPNDIGLLDLTALKESCFALLGADDRKKYSRIFTDKFFDVFVSLVLREYMVQQNNIRNNTVAISDYRLDNEEGFYNFKKRHERLSELQSRSSDMPEKAPVFNLIKWWEVPGRSELLADGDVDVGIVNEIITHIRRFFQQIEKPLLPGDKNLSMRIVWALKRFSCNRNYVPIIILLMVLSCRRQIAHATEIQFNTINFPVVFTGVGSAKQRYEELRLLEQLCEVFNLTPRELIRNAEEYIKFQGKQIQSRDEYVFWCRCLQRRYEQLPAIGFQLCYINYCTQCLYPHYETLCYSPASSLHLGGYYQFWKSNKFQLRKMALQLCNKNQKDIASYKKVWGDPEATNEKIREKIKKFTTIEVRTDALVFTQNKIEQDLDELKSLIVETIIRIYLYRKARKLLLKSFKVNGDFSLVDAVYHRIETSS